MLGYTSCRMYQNERKQLPERLVSHEADRDKVPINVLYKPAMLAFYLATKKLNAYELGILA